MLKWGVVLVTLVWSWGCSTPAPIPNVVRRNTGEPTPLTIPGPMPHFGPFTSVDDAILAACPLVLRQPHAVIPVRKDDQNFGVYWRTADEYCAWLYGVEGKAVEMSLFAANPVQGDPAKRQCDLPPYVADSRYSADSIVYLVIIHNHPFDKELSDHDVRIIVEMAKLHGFTVPFRGQHPSASIVAFIGQEKDGRAMCTKYYRFYPGRNGGDIEEGVLDSQSGRISKRPLGRIDWSHGQFSLGQ